MGPPCAGAATPLAVAVAAFGVSFGLLARSAGMGALALVVMSATTFAGSAQFAAVSILRAGGTIAAAAVAAVLLNARYGPIGASVAPSLRGPWWSRLVRSQLVVDESWALAAEGNGRFNPRILVGAGLTLYVALVGGTTIGVLGDRFLGDPFRLGWTRPSRRSSSPFLCRKSAPVGARQPHSWVGLSPWH